MISKNVCVGVTVKVNSEVAYAVARAELEGIYSSAGAECKLAQLEVDKINVKSLAKYYTQCAYLQAAFCEDKRSPGSKLKELGFRFSELKQLFLPTLTATILSQMGDVAIGGYRIEVYAAADAKVDHDWIVGFSEALYRNQHLLFCDKDQIGVANREADPNMMSAICVTVCEPEKVIQAGVFTGTNPDSRAIALNTMMGIVLVNQAYGILYPFEDYLYYGRPSTIVSISKPVS